MEIDLSTPASGAADALLAGVTNPAQVPAATVKLTQQQQDAVKVAVGALLEMAAIGEENVEVHFAASPEGRWAVLRVAAVTKER